MEVSHKLGCLSLVYPLSLELSSKFLASTLRIFESNKLDCSTLGWLFQLCLTFVGTLRDIAPLEWFAPGLYVTGWANKLECFVSGKLFQPSLTFSGMAEHPSRT